MGEARAGLPLTAELGAEPTPVESHDLLGSLAKEERKRAGFWEGGWNPTFLFCGPLLPGDSFSVLFLSKDAGQSSR